MDDFVRATLTEWNLEKYIPTFETEEINEEAFRLLTDEDIKEIFPLKGPRLRFLDRHKKATSPPLVQQPAQASSSSSVAVVTPQDKKAGQASDEEHGVEYSPQPGTGDSAEKGAKYEKDIPTLIFLRGVRKRHTFHLGSNVGHVHPHDDVFYIHTTKESDEWIAVLCQLKYNKGGELRKSNVVKPKEGKKDPFNCLQYAKLSIKKKEEMDNFINTCIKDARCNIADIEKHTKKYILFTNASVIDKNEREVLRKTKNPKIEVMEEDLKVPKKKEENLCDLLNCCEEFDELLNTRDNSKAYSFIQNGLDEDIKEYINEGKRIKDNKIEKLKGDLTKLNECLQSKSVNEHENDSKAHNHNQNDLERNKLQSEKNNLEKTLQQLKNESDLTFEEVNDFLKHFILYSNQLSPTLDDDSNCELSALLKRELKRTLNVNLSDHNQGNNVNDHFQENNVLDHFKSQVQNKLSDQFKKNKTITDKATFLVTMRGAVDALNTSKTTIQKWESFQFKAHNETEDNKIADDKTRSMDTKISTDKIRYYVNNDSVAWTTLKVTGLRRSMNKCTVHDMDDLFKNHNSIIDAFEVPCYDRHVLKSEIRTDNVDLKLVNSLAEDICKVLEQNRNKSKQMILIAKEKCTVTRELANRIKEKLLKH